MAASVAVALLVAFLTPVVVVYLFTRRPASKKPLPGKLPPGSLGLPMIGQSLGLLRAMRSNTGERWLRDRVDRYGPVSKLSLFGAPTVFVTGLAANKLVFRSDALAPKQPRCLPLILGRRNILELDGDDYRRVRGAMMQFLKPDVLRRYVGTIDAEVARHLGERWAGRRTVAVLPLMKLLTFDIIATLLFGLERGAVRERLAAAFAEMVEGMWSVPLDLPFTKFRKSLRASARARRALEATLAEKRARLERGEASPADDLVSCLASLRRRAAADGRGDRGQRHARPRRRPRHVVRAHDVHDPPPRGRSCNSRRYGSRARRDRQEQGRRRGADMGGPERHAVHMARGPGDDADDPTHLRELPASAGGHRVRRLLHPQGVAGVLGVQRDAHGPQHLPGAGQVPAGAVREPGAALLVRGVRRRAEAVRRDRVRQGGDAGHHAPPAEALQVEALLRGQGQHVRQGPHAVAVERAAHRAREQRHGVSNSKQERVRTLSTVP